RNARIGADAGKIERVCAVRLLMAPGRSELAIARQKKDVRSLGMLEAEVLCHEQARLPGCDGSRPTRRRDVTILDAGCPRPESDVGPPYRTHAFRRRPLRVRAYRKGEAINYLALLAQPDLHRALVRPARRNHELERVLAGRERLEDGRSVPLRGRSRAHRRAV